LNRLLRSETGRLRLLSLVEGASYLVLVGVAVPLKYLAGEPGLVQVMGRVHGVLFVLFIIALARAAASASWRASKIAFAILCAMLPLGAFVFEWRLRKSDLKEEEKT
jgi:integral membrane protein